MKRVFLPRAARRRPPPHNLFDGCQAALVWLAALALIAPGPFTRDFALGAMAAIALAASLAALFPAAIGLSSTPPPAPPSPPAKEPDDVVRPH